MLLIHLVLQLWLIGVLCMRSRSSCICTYPAACHRLPAVCAVAHMHICALARRAYARKRRAQARNTACAQALRWNVIHASPFGPGALGAGRGALVTPLPTLI